VWLPSFRPDGERILFTRTQDHGRHLGLWTVDAQGGDARLLRQDAAYGVYSPDGRAIAYHRVLESVKGVGWPFDFGL
jgi:Tol biopolymer transport system component